MIKSRKKFSHQNFNVHDFVFTKKTINHIKKGSIGIIKRISYSQITVFFIGKGQIIKIKKETNSIQCLDVEKTGKTYRKKICNICHILKNKKVDFSINQTDAKGRKTTRPSCKECRKKIEGVKLLNTEKKKLDKIAPKKKTIFTCPICEKRTIVGVTAHLVRDHNHKTGKARAWICDSCNTGLGRFKDDINLMKRIIKYLEQYQ